MNNIPRQMIVQSQALSNSFSRPYILLTNKTNEELQNATVPIMSVPECTTLPLTKTLDELWGERGTYNAQMNVACRDAEVTILTDQRHDRNGYKYVGLIHSMHSSSDGDEVECWNRDGEPESGDPDHKLGSFPEERFGYIAIYKGTVTDSISLSESEAIQLLKHQVGLSTDFDPKDVFVIQIGCWVTDDETKRVV